MERYVIVIVANVGQFAGRSLVDKVQSFKPAAHRPVELDNLLDDSISPWESNECINFEIC